MSSTHPERPIAGSNTQSISINALPDDVFAFVADPLNFPQWAVGFCRSIRPDDTDRWIATTPSGQIPIWFERNVDARTIDFHFEPAPGLVAVAYSRIVPNATGCEYVFTQFQGEGMTDEVFDAQVQALIEELHVLRGVMQARAACRLQFVRERP